MQLHTHRRETTCSKIRLQPPAKRVNCTNCAEHSLNALHRWEWTQVPTGLHKAPLPYAFFCYAYATMNIDTWACQASLGGRLMHPIISINDFSLWRDVWSCCGGPAGPYWHPAKSSGSKGIWWKMSSSSPKTHWGIHNPILTLTYAFWDLHLRVHTHIRSHEDKSLAQNGSYQAPGEPAQRPWPLLSLPSGSSRTSASNTVGCLRDVVLETIRPVVVWWPWRPCPSDKPWWGNLSQIQTYALRHRWLCRFLCNSCSHGLILTGPEKLFQSC